MDESNIFCRWGGHTGSFHSTCERIPPSYNKICKALELNKISNYRFSLVAKKLIELRIVTKFLETASSNCYAQIQSTNFKLEKKINSYPNNPSREERNSHIWVWSRRGGSPRRHGACGGYSTSTETVNWKGRWLEWGVKRGRQKSGRPDLWQRPTITAPTGC